MRYSTIFILILATIQPSIAAESEIHLQDGSIISGEILSFDGKIYRIKSKSLGQIELSESKIDVIRTSTGKTGAGKMPPNPGSKQQNITAIQQQLMSNPDIMRLITSLQNDPQVRKLLSDPKLMQSISTGDINALENNPEFKSLLNNPSIQNILNISKP